MENKYLKVLDDLEKVLNEKNLWKLKISRDDPAIVVEGTRNGLIWILKDVLNLDNFKSDRELDLFEIAVDLENLYISFFMKPEYYYA